MMQSPGVDVVIPGVDVVIPSVDVRLAMLLSCHDCLS